MQIVKKSLTRKLFLYLFVFGSFIAILALFLYFFSQKDVPLIFLIASLFLFLVSFLLFFWVHVVKPLNVVIAQMHALITGNDYKKIFSARTDEIGVLAYFFNRFVQSLGKVSFNIIDRQRMLDELSIASQLQRDILPLKTPFVPGIDIVAKNKPASELGGDSFNIFTVNGKTYIYIGDVTGHGVAGGLVMTMVNTLISVFSGICDNAYDVVVNVNKHIKTHIKKAMYMTMVILCWDHEKEKMTYVGAGHEHILVYRKAIGQCEAILSGGVALGMVPDNSALVKEIEIVLNDGDFIVLFTDGLTEARNMNEEMYGLERLKSSVLDYAPEYSAEGVNYNIARDVSAFMEGRAQDDDMTLIVVERNLAAVAEVVEVSSRTNWDVK